MMSVFIRGKQGETQTQEEATGGWRQRPAQPHDKNCWGPAALQEPGGRPGAASPGASGVWTSSLWSWERIGFSLKPPVGGHLFLQPQDLLQTPRRPAGWGLSVRPVTSGPPPPPLVSALGPDVPLCGILTPVCSVLCESASLDLSVHWTAVPSLL